MQTKATFTELLRSPKKVLAHVDEGDIVVSRRGQEDLVVSRASAHEKDLAGLRLASSLTAISLADGDFVERLHGPFPWLTFLKRIDQDSFATEIVAVARACASVGYFGRLAITISAWEATATAVAEGLPADGSDLDYLDEPTPAERP